MTLYSHLKLARLYIVCLCVLDGWVWCGRDHLEAIYELMIDVIAVVLAF